MLILEDGSIVPNANTVVEVAEFREFMQARMYDTSSMSDDKVSAYLIRAADYLLYLNYVGLRASATQDFPFPRSGVYLEDDRLLPVSAIPVDLKRAQIWLTFYLGIKDIDLSAAPVDRVVREKIDVLEIEYSRSGSNTKTFALALLDLPNVEMCLRYLIRGNGESIGNGRIDRA